MKKLNKVDDNEYEIIDKGDENFHQIRLNESSPFPDVVFQFGEVQLREENDQLRVKFDYEVFDNPNKMNTESEKFVNYIGDILMTNLEELLIFNKYQKEKRSNGV